ncbi:MAG: DNA polymerase III subunit delta [Gammaproteobacteria bacterium]|nr:DNA polymerase III subunit delta [Gammaproteobacteria bacterium]MYH84478.1 DNA polymerase III subunit delta [Gammaproteobacteria bacterium]MYK05506.1 DNA polymerase III subunit delta [Gammaproteobacteria bacterium]
MKIRGDQLSSTLARQSAPLYWLAGDEILLLREAADEVRRHWRQAGFTEREVFHVEQGFDWNDFLYQFDATSLFAEQKLLELRLYSAKLDAKGREAITAWLDKAPEDYRVLISGPRIDSSVLSAKWFKNLDDKLVLVQIWPIDRARLPAWLRQRLAAAGIQPDDDALQILTDRVEGNLLAAEQEIEKLALLADAEPGANKRLTGNDVLRLVSDSSRYDLGKLADAALKGDAERAQRVLGGLRAEGVFPLLILAVLTRELRQLLTILDQIDQGHEIGQAMSAARIWQSRKPIVSQALKRLTADKAQQMLEHCKLIDHSVKGLHRANPWDELSLLVLRICGERFCDYASLCAE